MAAAKNLLCQAIEMGHRVTRAYVSDFTDAELLVRSAPGANHIAWQLGHMIGSVRRMLSALGCPVPALPEGFEAAHSKENVRLERSGQVCHQGPVPRADGPDEGRVAGRGGRHARGQFRRARTGTDASARPDGRLRADVAGHALADARGSIRADPPQTGQTDSVLKIEQAEGSA